MANSATESSSHQAATNKPDALGKQTQHGNSALLTAGIIVADVVGAGILTMPSAVARLGWLLGGVVMTLMLMANVHISIIMWRVRMGAGNETECRTYEDLASFAFAKAPTWQRASIVAVTRWSQSIFCFAILGVYVLSAGKGIGMAFYWARVCLPQWSLAAALILLPFAATAQKMGAYQSLVGVNIVTLSGTVLIPLGYCVYYGTDGLRPEDSKVEPVAELSLTGVLYSLSAFTFGMTSQFMLNEIMSEMKDISELPKAYSFISAPFQLAAFLIAGVGGYVLMGSDVTGMINENLPFNVSFQVSALCLVTHMLISYLIKGVVVGNLVRDAVFPKYAGLDDTDMRGKMAWAAIAMGVIAVAYTIANVVPFFGDAVDLLGASLTPISCWMIPIALYLRYLKDAPDVPRPCKFEFVVMFLEVALALVLLFVGTYTACITLGEHWHTFGYPFACQCQGLWDTCDCNSAHPGMAGACPEIVLANHSLHGILHHGGD